MSSKKNLSQNISVLFFCVTKAPGTNISILSPCWIIYIMCTTTTGYLQLSIFSHLQMKKVELQTINFFFKKKSWFWGKEKKIQQIKPMFKYINQVT